MEAIPMRSQSLPQAESEPRRLFLRRLSLVARGPAKSLVVCAASFLFFSAALAAQTSPAQTTSSSAPPAAPIHKHVHPHKKPAAAVLAPPPAPAPAPVLPPPPNWPANDTPAVASVVYDSRGLLIVASNSSLAQILKDVSTDTGAKVEGMGTDQRIFGTYGPGPAREVLSQLLDGSGYNILMVGDRGEGTPRRIVLSPQAGGGMQNTAKNNAPTPGNDDTEADQPEPEPEPEPAPAPPPVQNDAAPPVPVRTPQQIMEERSRQQQQTPNGQQNPQN
jgi:hypothetical protein